MTGFIFLGSKITADGDCRNYPNKSESEEFRSRSDFGGLRAAPVRELRRMHWFGLWALQGRAEP